MEFGKNANKEIREQMKGLKAYMIAFQLGIDPSTFARWLSIPMTDERKKRTLQAIKEVKRNGQRKV